jgi:hypothetical protein
MSDSSRTWKNKTTDKIISERLIMLLNKNTTIVHIIETGVYFYHDKAQQRRIYIINN